MWSGLEPSNDTMADDGGKRPHSHQIMILGLSTRCKRSYCRKRLTLTDLCKHSADDALDEDERAGKSELLRAIIATSAASGRTNESELNGRMLHTNGPHIVIYSIFFF